MTPTWAIVELLGKTVIAGLVSEETMFGQTLGRIDIPLNNNIVTQYFSGASIYRITPTTEEIATAIAKAHQPQPIRMLQLRDVIPNSNDDDNIPF